MRCGRHQKIQGPLILVLPSPLGSAMRSHQCRVTRGTQQHRFAEVGTQCYFSPEDNRLNSCLRKPRRNRVVSLAAPPLGTSTSAAGETSGIASCSDWVSLSVELAI